MTKLDLMIIMTESKEVPEGCSKTHKSWFSEITEISQPIRYVFYDRVI